MSSIGILSSSKFFSAVMTNDNRTTIFMYTLKFLFLANFLLICYCERNEESVNTRQNVPPLALRVSH